MAVCLLCKDASKADKANRLLLERSSVRDVAAAIGVSKSAVDRHKRGCLAKALTMEYPEKAKTLATIENKPKPAAQQNTKAKPFAPPESAWALNSPTDYQNYLQWLQDKSTELVNRASDTDNLRMMQTAIKEARDNATAMAKAKGWIQEASPQDNRQVNIFQGIPVDALLSMRDSLQRALQPAMVTIEHDA